MVIHSFGRSCSLCQVRSDRASGTYSRRNRRLHTRPVSLDDLLVLRLSGRMACALSRLSGRTDRVSAPTRGIRLRSIRTGVKARITRIPHDVVLANQRRTRSADGGPFWRVSTAPWSTPTCYMSATLDVRSLTSGTRYLSTRATSPEMRWRPSSRSEAFRPTGSLMTVSRVPRSQVIPRCRHDTSRPS